MKRKLLKSLIASIVAIGLPIMTASATASKQSKASIINDDLDSSRDLASIYSSLKNQSPAPALEQSSPTSNNDAYSKDEDIKTVQKEIRSWKKGYLNMLTNTFIEGVSQPVEVNFNSLQKISSGISMPSLPDGVSLTYTHDRLDEDGTLVVNFIISKSSGVSVEQKFEVEVVGINKAKANQDIKSVQDQIKVWNNDSLTIDKESIEPVPAGTPLDSNDLKALAPNLDYPTNIPDGVTLTYSHPGLTSNGTLNVVVQVSKSPGNPFTQNFDVQVTGIDENKANQDIKSVQDQIITWTSGTLNTSTSISVVPAGTPLDSKALKALAPNLDYPINIPDGVTLTYSHPGINSNGKLNVKVKISKKFGDTKEYDLNVQVTGIDENNANQVIKSVQDQIKFWNNDSLTIDKESIEPVPAGTPLDSKALKALAPNLDYPTNIPNGIKFTYSHPGLTSNGTLKVVVQVSKSPGNPFTQNFDVQVTGIDENKANKDIKSIYDQIKVWKKDSITVNKESIEPVPSGTPLDSKALKALAPNLVYPTKNNGTSIFYTHPGLAHDGLLKVSIIISKAKGETLTHDFEVDVKGINQFASKTANIDIKKVKDIIENIGVGNLYSPSIIQVQNPTPLDSKALKALAPNLDYPINIPDGVTLTYSHPGINSNGTLTISVKISKFPGNPFTQNFDVQVIGIDENKANQDIKSVYDQIKVWNNDSLTINKESIEPVPAGTPLDSKALKALAPNFAYPNNIPNRVTLTYSHKGIKKNGPLKVQVKVEKLPGKFVIQDFIVKVTGFDIARRNQANKDIKFVQDQIKLWTKGILNTSKTSVEPVSTPAPLDSKALKALTSKIVYPTNMPDGVTLAYTHKGTLSNGALTISVTISKSPGISLKQNFNVQVVGINEAKANQAIKSVQDQILKWKSASLTTNKTYIEPVSTPTPFDSKALKALAPNLFYLTNLNGVKLTYTHKGTLSNGPLKISVKMEKSPGKVVTQDFTVQVTGINEAKANKDIKFVQDQIKLWTKGILNTSKTSIEPVPAGTPFDSKALKALAPNLAYPINIPSGIKITYSHKALDHDDILKFQVKIEKSPGTSVKQEFDLEVTGINLAIKNQANQDIKSVQDQIKLWKTDSLVLSDKINSQPTPTPFDSKALKALAPNLAYPTHVPDGVSLTYTHKALEQNGTLKVHVTISKSPGTSVTKDFEVKVSGINQAIIESNKDIKSVQDQINAWPNGVLNTSKTSIEPVPAGTPFDSKALNALAEKSLTYPSVQNGVNLTYTHKALEQNGTLKVHVTISKSPGKSVTKDFEIEVTGINKAKANEDIKSVQNQIIKWNKDSLTTTKTSIPAVENPKPFDSKALKTLVPNLKFPVFPKGTKLSYTHKGIEKKGTLKVRVKIEKSPGTTAIEEFKVSISLKNKQKVKKFSKKEIILMCFFGELLLILIVVLSQIIKSKKRI